MIERQKRSFTMSVSAVKKRVKSVVVSQLNDVASFTVGLRDAMMRTIISKSGSSSTHKQHKVKDAEQLNLVRGDGKKTISAIVFMEGKLSIEENGVMQQRVDRTKLLCQALLNLLQEENAKACVPVTTQTVKDEAVRLYNLYRDNVDISAPTAEAFDKSITRTLGEDFAEIICTPIRTVPKLGDISTAGISFTIVGSSIGEEGCSPELCHHPVSKEQADQIKSLTKECGDPELKNVAGHKTNPTEKGKKTRIQKK